MWIHRIISIVSIGSMALWQFSCGATVKMEDVSPPPAPRPVVGEPEFDIDSFNVLYMPVKKGELPWISQGSPAGDPQCSTSSGEIQSEFCSPEKRSLMDTSCFEAADNVDVWITENPMVKANVTAHADAIQQTILRWLVDNPLKDQPYAEKVQTFEIAIDGLTIRNDPQGTIRMKIPAACIPDDTRMLPENSRIVTTLFGARTLTFRSELAIDKTILTRIKIVAKLHGYSYKATPSYPKALDAKGNPIKKKRGYMFVAPDGSIVPAKDVPPASKRPTFEFTLTFNEALYFAEGNLPLSNWSRETRPEICSLNLIYDDLTPRIPECAELNDAGFGISTSSTDGEITLKMSADGEVVKASVPFDKPARLEVGGRVIAWVTPKKIEEGAVLQIDSVVLYPSKTKAADLKAFTFGP